MWIFYKRSRAYVKPEANRSTVWGVVCMVALQCPALDEYVKPHENYDYNINHRRLAVHFLTGIDLGGEDEHGPITLQRLYNFSYLQEQEIYRPDNNMQETRSIHSIK